MNNKSLQYIAYALKGGIFILPLLSLIVATSMFFPFITGKNFFFRIMVEILFLLWVFLAVFDKRYRPRKSPVFVAFAATLFFLTLSSIFGANPYRSFWSNYERMEGLIGHIHLFIYFLILTCVLLKEKDWRWFFRALAATSVILTGYGFLQFFGFLNVHQSDVRLDATLGNATYYAIFLIFHLFFIGFLLLKTQNRWLKWGLAILLALDALLVFMTATRGAILGLLAGAFIFVVLMAVLNFRRSRKVRKISLICLGILALAIILFLPLKNTSFVRNNYVLSRMATISFSERTVESRFTIWKMSLSGFLERPFIGWGPENYNLVFNKYYEPSLYKQEPWFDRSHNVFFDWLITAGILGFLAYWSMWAAAILVVVKGYKRKVFSPAEISLFFALFIAYAIHNLFVFDNLTSYFLFFSVLGYLHFKYNTMNSAPAEEERQEKANTEIGVLSYLLLTLVFVAVIFSLYFANLKPILAGRQLLTTLSEVRQKGTNVNFMLGEFDKVFSYKTFGTIEAREQLSGYAEQVLASQQSFSQEDKNKVINKAIEEMEKQIEILPNDARAYIFLGTLYTKSGQLEKAFETVNKAIQLSPKKQEIRFVLADIYLSSGQYDKAVEALREAYDFDRTYSQAGRNLLTATILQNKPGEEEKLLIELEKEFGPKFSNDERFVNVYAKMGNFQKIKKIWQTVLEDNPGNAQAHVSLAATYLQLQERENAIKELQKAIEINPEFKQQGEYFISEIRAGRNP